MQHKDAEGNIYPSLRREINVLLFSVAEAYFTQHQSKRVQSKRLQCYNTYLRVSSLKHGVCCNWNGMQLILIWKFNYCI